MEVETNGYKLIQTSHIVISWFIIIFLAGGSWAWSNFRINNLENQSITMQADYDIINKWIVDHQREGDIYSKERTRQYYETRLNLKAICKKLGIEYTTIDIDDIQKYPSGDK